MSAEAAEKMLARLKPTTSYADISGVDLVFEAVSEVQKIKDQVTAAVCAVIRPDVPIASNTRLYLFPSRRQHQPSRAIYWPAFFRAG